MIIGVNKSALSTFLAYTRQKTGYTNNNNVSSYLAAPSENTVRLRKQLKELSEKVEKSKSQVSNFKNKIKMERNKILANPQLSMRAQANLSSRAVLKRLK